MATINLLITPLRHKFLTPNYGMEIHVSMRPHAEVKQHLRHAVGGELSEEQAAACFERTATTLEEVRQIVAQYPTAWVCTCDAPHSYPEE